jgi:diacylglycerol kinase family enzyme
MLTARPGHAAELAGDTWRSCERIYVLSGDGGFNEAVNGMSGRVPMGFLPAGATNVLPRALGLPRDPVECARALARSKRIRRISLGRVNGRRFTFGAGLGLDAELVRAGDRFGRHGGRRPRDAVFVWSLTRLIAARRGRFEPAMTVAGHGRVAFALVAKCDPYSYVGRVPVRVAPEARFELGLDLVAPLRLRPARLPTLVYWVLARPGQARAPDVLYVHDADELRIDCDRPTALQADGEDLGDVTEAVFEAERDALDVVVVGPG